MFVNRRGVAAALALFLPTAGWAQADHTYATRYDALRRVVGTIAPDPDGSGPLRHAAVRHTYDAAGLLVRVERGELAAWQGEAVAPAAWPGFTVHGQADTSYDALGRKVAERVSGGGAVEAATQWSYDAAGLLECTAVRMNAGAYAGLPASACALGPEGDFGPDRITRNLYDSGGQLLKVAGVRYATPAGLRHLRVYAQRQAPRRHRCERQPGGDAL